MSQVSGDTMSAVGSAVGRPEDRPGQRRGGSQRLRLLAFAGLFGAALVSGFYYYLVPHGINWNAAQVMLIAHIALGVLAFVALAPFVVAHQRHQDGSSLLLLAPWLRRWRRGAGAAEAHPQRLVGHALHWSLLLVVASGVFVAVPGLLFYAGAVWLLTYESYQVGNAVHLGLTVVALGLMLLHWRLLRRLRARNDRR